jgi:hypothetical protein
MQAEQLVLTLVIAALVLGDATLLLLFLAQLGIGIGNALNAPAFQGTMPNLVPKEDLPGAISLNSVMINGSRVIGPTIAAVLMSRGCRARGDPRHQRRHVPVRDLRDLPHPHPEGGERDGREGAGANFMTGLRLAASGRCSPADPRHGALLVPLPAVRRACSRPSPGSTSDLAP